MKWKLLKKKKNGQLDEEEKGMLAAYEDPVDFTDKDNLIDLLTYIKK